MGQITVYTGTTSAQFYVDKLSPVKGFIEEFVNKNLTEFEYDKQKHTYTFICNYVIWDEKTNNLIIPINFLPLLESYLETCGYPKVFKEVPLEPIKPRQSSIKPNPDWKPREHQIPIIDYLLHDSRSRKGVSLQTGGGKAAINGTLVKIPNGWKPIEQLKIGDMVIAPDGKAYPVTGVYSHKDVDLFKLTFKDKRSVITCGEHLWETMYHYCGSLRKEIEKTSDIMSYIKGDPNNHPVYIPLIEPEQKEDIDLPLDPYVLGSLLSNGTMTGKCEAVNLYTPHRECIDIVRSRLPEQHEIHQYSNLAWGIVATKEIWYNKVRKALKDLGLWGCYSHTKFIPELYMNASPKQKMELIQGLMDGDGSMSVRKPRISEKTGKVINAAGALTYCSTSEKLIRQLQELIWSMGDVCLIDDGFIGKPKIYNGQTITQRHKTFKIHIRAKHPSNYFKIAYKKNRTRDNCRFAKSPKLRIDSVIPVGKGNATCISVDSPNNTYVLENYIVTHNTFIANYSAAQLGLVTMVIMGSNIPQWVKNISEQTTVHENFEYLDSNKYNNIYKWVKECNAQAKERGSKIWILMGSDSFYQLVNDKVHPDIFVCSISTLREFIENGEAYKNLPWNWQGFLKEYGIGTKIVDEAHQNFHAVNKLDLLSNIKNNIALTATFLKTGISASRIFDRVYPPEMRYGDSNVAQYTNCTVYAYRGMVPAHFVKRKRGYNAIKYEQYLLKRPMWMKDYLNNVVLPEVYMHYVKKRNEGEKCLLFFSTKAMIERVRDFLNFELAKYGIVAKEKIGGTPDDVLNDPQYHIYIGTPGGMGTGRDIPHLRTAINFVSFDSPVLTKQCYGRLRRIPGVDTEWVDNVDRMIDSQVRHWQKRDKFYRKAAKTYHKIKLS